MDISALQKYSWGKLRKIFFNGENVPLYKTTPSATGEMDQQVTLSHR